MFGVGRELMPAEMLREDPFARRERLRLVHRIEAEAAPGGLRAFHDEGRGVGLELVGVRPDPAVFGFLEDERERVIESLSRPEPDVLAGPHVDIRLEDVSERAAALRVRTVGEDHEIVPAIAVGALDLGFELKREAQLARPILENIEQALTPDPA